MKAHRPALSFGPLLALALAACTKPAPTPDQTSEPVKAPPASTGEAAATGAAANDDKAATGGVAQAPSGGGLPMADVPIPDPPTPEELELLERDPATLTPQERKARALARYKQVMQDPNSREAQVIRQARAAIESGQNGQSPIGGPTFSAPVATPNNPKPAAVDAPAQPKLAPTPTPAPTPAQ